MAKNLGQNIRDKRLALGLKVYELAQKVEVNPVYITQIEKHGKLPSPSIIERIEHALQIELKTKYFAEKLHKLNLSDYSSLSAPGTDSSLNSKELKLFKNVILKKPSITNAFAGKLLKELNNSKEIPNAKYISEVKKLLKEFIKTYSKLRYLVLETDHRN